MPAAPLIAVLSHSATDRPTEEVIAWLRHLGARFERINGDDLADEVEFAVEVSNQGARARFDLDAAPVESDGVAAVWFRRFHRHGALDHWRGRSDPALGAHIQVFLTRELQALRGAVGAGLHRARWLLRMTDTPLNKLQVLQAAARVGIDVPATLVSNSRAAVADFLACHGRIICKPISDIESFLLEGREFPMFTGEVTAELLEQMPPRFFPSLLQEMVEKRYELRVFCLDGRCWAMAMFTQADAQTAVDFRDYNLAHPARAVPFALPPELEARVAALMAELRLDIGAIDFIRARDGRYVFLEVNPHGQFAMVSDECNYRLEKHVAEHLIAAAAA